MLIVPTAVVALQKVAELEAITRKWDCGHDRHDESFVDLNCIACKVRQLVNQLKNVLEIHVEKMDKGSAAGAR